MGAIRDLMRRVLRYPADALISSSRSFPARVDECLRNSPALEELIAARLAEARNGTGRVSVESLDPFVQEGTGPYPYFLEEAEKLGMDVNDYLEDKLEWGSVRPMLERGVFPLLRSNSVVCELGAGTGRWSREILKEIPRGQLHIVDYSPWFVSFLTDYFAADPRVRVHQNDGFSIPITEEKSVDLVVSFGTLIMLKLGNIYRYAQEFFRVLKPGCHCVVEYIDIDTPEGWQWLKAQSSGAGDAGCFTYYTPEIMARVFAEAGMEVVGDEHIAEWHEEYPYRFLTARRPS